MDDKEYRARVRELFERVLKTIDAMDPDVVEAELSQGTLTIVAKGQKTILSPQPPVKQIWLAVASKGIALHFSFEAETQRWLDDKGQGREVLSYTSEVLSQLSGQAIRLR